MKGLAAENGLPGRCAQICLVEFEARAPWLGKTEPRGHKHYPIKSEISAVVPSPLPAPMEKHSSTPFSRSAARIVS